MKEQPNPVQLSSGLIAGAVFILLLVAGLLLAGSADGQEAVRSVEVVAQEERVTPEENFEVSAYVVNGSNGRINQGGTIDAFQMLLAVHSEKFSKNLETSPVMCWDEDDFEWVILKLGQQPPNACTEPTGFEPIAHADWRAPFPPVTDEGTEVRNISAVQVGIETESDLVLSNTKRSGQTEIMIVDSKDQLFNHKSMPTDFERFAELTALEFLVFPLLGLIGIVVWSRSLDMGVRAFGAFLTIFGGTAALGFSIDRGLGAVWRGMVPLAVSLVAAGGYMLLRQFIESFTEDEGREPA